MKLYFIIKEQFWFGSFLPLDSAQVISYLITLSGRMERNVNKYVNFNRGKIFLLNNDDRSKGKMFFTFVAFDGFSDAQTAARGSVD